MLQPIIRGGTYSFVVNFSQTIGGVVTPVDLTGKTVFFALKKRVYDADDDAVIWEEVTSHVNPPQGKTTIDITDDETRDIPTGKYFFSLKLSDGTTKTPVLQGSVDVLDDVLKNV